MRFGGGDEMPIDEKELGEMIFAKGSVLLPAAYLFVGYYVFTGNQWLAAPIALAMAAAYHAKGWDGRHLLAWGVGTMLLAFIVIWDAQWTANSLAIDAYWLCLAGLARLGSGLAFDGDEKAKEGGWGKAGTAPARRKKTRVEEDGGHPAGRLWG
jgi:hypothetical protein